MCMMQILTIPSPRVTQTPCPSPLSVLVSLEMVPISSSRDVSLFTIVWFVAITFIWLLFWPFPLTSTLMTDHALRALQKKHTYVAEFDTRRPAYFDRSIADIYPPGLADVTGQETCCR
uniref:(northern house mosquito) hypothetical protein n=1 Tax=Culex pipiens TaxID=7175 RepID=A0A8D8MBZ5_CULPI